MYIYTMFISVRTDLLDNLHSTGRSIYTKQWTFCYAGEKLPTEQWQSRSAEFIPDVLLSLHWKFKVINVGESRNQASATFVVGTFLCCAFSYRVLGKSDRSVAVTLQRLLKADRARWFPGKTVDIKQRTRGTRGRRKTLLRITRCLPAINLTYTGNPDIYLLINNIHIQL